MNQLVRLESTPECGLPLMLLLVDLIEYVKDTHADDLTWAVETSDFAFVTENDEEIEEPQAAPGPKPEVAAIRYNDSDSAQRVTVAVPPGYSVFSIPETLLPQWEDPARERCLLVLVHESRLRVVSDRVRAYLENLIFFNDVEVRYPDGSVFLKCVEEALRGAWAKHAAAEM